ncbi:MAG: xylan 1,4-beta-xylosidase [Actinomycetia bacterium]|nr:xylan 1,4-beta-xylosidase [Actinomycetes bacterium]
MRDHTGTFENQHIMGWGARSPEPTPGTYLWADLDRRVALIRATGGTPVITLCCAPDWMKGGSAGVTDWSRLTIAPTAAHYKDYADLARRIALRYPDVHYFQVWNEMKGFYDPVHNRWRYKDYTALYNEVYDALKKVDRNIKVGGPYVVMDSCAPGACSHPSRINGPWGVLDQRPLDVLSYWFTHAHGADFVAVDGGTRPKGRDYLVSPYDSTDKYRAVDVWLRSHTKLPIWWSEFYPVPYGYRGHWSMQSQVKVMTKALRVVQGSGGSVVLFWQPEGQDGWTGLWTGTAAPAGGAPTPIYNAVAPWLGGTS